MLRSNEVYSKTCIIDVPKSGLPITKTQNVICSDSEFKGMWRQFSLVNIFLVMYC